MPVTVLVSPGQLEEYSRLPDDPELDELLQKIRNLTGREWLIRRRTAKLRSKVPFRKKEVVDHGLLIHIAGIEYQLINLVTDNGGSVFRFCQESREMVMNYIIGYCGGYIDRGKNL